QLRFLDRYRTRRHTHLSDLVFASSKVAYVDQSFRRGDDAVCGNVRGNFCRHSSRPVLDGVVFGAYSEQLGHLAKLSQRADVGRIRSLNLFYRLGSVLVHRSGPGFGNVARSRYHEDQEISVRNFCSWLARVESQLAALRDGGSALGWSFYTAGSLGTQRRILLLCHDTYSHMAYHSFPALFRCRRHLRRVRDGADAALARSRDLQVAGRDHTTARR